MLGIDDPAEGGVADVPALHLAGGQCPCAAQGAVALKGEVEVFDSAPVYFLGDAGGDEASGGVAVGFVGTDIGPLATGAVVALKIVVKDGRWVAEVEGGGSGREAVVVVGRIHKERVDADEVEAVPHAAADLGAAVVVGDAVVDGTTCGEVHAIARVVCDGGELDGGGSACFDTNRSAAAGVVFVDNAVLDGGVATLDEDGGAVGGRAACQMETVNGGVAGRQAEEAACALTIQNGGGVLATIGFAPVEQVVTAAQDDGAVEGGDFGASARAGSCNFDDIVGGGEADDGLEVAVYVAIYAAAVEAGEAGEASGVVFVGTDIEAAVKRPWLLVEVAHDGGGGVGRVDVGAGRLEVVVACARVDEERVADD